MAVFWQKMTALWKKYTAPWKKYTAWPAALLEASGGIVLKFLTFKIVFFKNPFSHDFYFNLRMALLEEQHDTAPVQSLSDCHF